MTGFVVLCALGVGIGAAGLLRAMTRRPEPETRPGTGGRVRISGRMGPVVLALAVGAFSALVTGWPVAFPLGAMTAYGLPRLFRETATSASVARLEAIATWTEMLQGTLAASAGLGQAIVATASLAPAPIRDATMTLSARISAGMHPEEALRRFGDELGDPFADRVICALLLATTARAQRLGELLGALAESTRDEVAIRLRVETSRASVRSSVRTVLVVSVGFAVALVVLSRTYLAPFGTAQGQVVLAMVGALYAGGLTLMVVLSRPPAPVRLLGREVEAQ